MFTLQATALVKGKPVTVNTFDNDLFTLELQWTPDAISASLTAKQGLTFQTLALHDTERHFGKNDIFFANGYQSWSTSVERQKWETADGYFKLADHIKLGQYLVTANSDYNFNTYGEKGVFHSATFTYFRKKGDSRIRLYGSRSERNGFTFFDVDMQRGRFSILKDVEGLVLEAGQVYDLLDLCIIDDEYDDAFDRYFFDFCGFEKPKVTRMAGYTSWYNYFRNINEDIILRDLKGLDPVQDKTDIFQIDDGYSPVGDWTSCYPDKFPHGLKPIVEEIHGKGYKAGLWLAPLNVQRKSETFRKHHRDWLVMQGKHPQLAILNWGDTYLLDIENPEVRHFLKDTFDTILNDWGFDMVKLDFLYSACTYPRNGKTRGQLMCEAVDLLRECCGDKIILGCGVPLGACMGIFDACRIGCDANKVYGGDIANKLKVSNEIPSARHAMENTAFRRCLDGRAFANDPDVFFLRDTNLKFTEEQKLDLAKVNDLCGSILFMSDAAGQYSPTAMEYLTYIFAQKDYEVILAEYVSQNVLRIDYLENGVQKKLQFNLKTGRGNVFENI